MATHFFGLNRGEQSSAVAKATSTTGKSMELAVNDAVGIKKSEILLALEAFKQSILDDRATPFI
jgi:hypothetical protein